MQMVDLNNILWFLGLLAEAAVVGLLVYRRIWRSLPVFCFYCVWNLLSDAVTYATLRFFPSSYLTAYLLQTFLDSALQFGILVELSWSVLLPLRSSLSRSTLLMVGVLGVLLGAAIWPFSGIHQLAGLPTEMRNLVRLQQTASILRILFFLVLAGCSQLLSIGWRDREMQIATGLGFYSIVSLAVEILDSHQAMGPSYWHLNQLVVACDICSLLYWVVCFAQKEAERREFTPQMQSFLLAVAGSAGTTRKALADATAADRGKR
jgi:xanthosine utilization system XapX-like protein